MQLKVCGCAGGESPDRLPAAFIIDQELALDAGSLARGLPLAEQCLITRVLLSHSHLDHCKDLAFLPDNVTGVVDQYHTIDIHGSPETIGALKDHFFNGQLWPDFSRIPTPEKPFYKYCPVAPENEFTAGPFTCLPIATDHTIPNLAYLVWREGKSICYSGDTGPTTRLWQILAAEKNLGALILEVSYPGVHQDQARRSGHLTTADLARALANFPDRSFPVFITHCKPKYEAPIRQEIQALDLAACHFLNPGMVIEI